MLSVGMLEFCLSCSIFLAFVKPRFVRQTPRFTQTTRLHQNTTALCFTLQLKHIVHGQLGFVCHFCTSHFRT